MGSLTPETCSPNSQTSFGSCPWMLGQELHVNTADELGMKALNDRFYAPFLTCELERLFSPPTGNSPDSQAPLRSVWAEFENNGHDTELDDLDRLFRGMSTDEHSKKAQQLENLPAPLIMNDIRDVGLLHSGHDLPQVTPLELQRQAASLELKQATSNLMEDIFTKARLIEILRERERLQRSRPKKVQKKASTTKVCVFCRNNGEAETVYSSHQLKDPEGNVTCPILYIYTCPICGANGKMAHTIKYCPYNSGESLCIQPLNRGITSPIGKQLVSLI